MRSNNGGLDWEVVRPAGEGFTSVTFADRTTGWAVAPKTILQSVDGGETWLEQTDAVDIGIVRAFNAVTALSATRAVIVGGFTPVTTTDFFGPVNIRLTMDGGATWPSLRVTGSGSARGQLTTVCFTDAGIGFSCGQTFGGGLCALGDDTGSDWISIAARVRGLAVACVGDATLWTIDPAGFFQSTDGGETFTDRSAALPSSFRGVEGGLAFTTEMLGWFVGSDDTGRAAVLHTNDGGATWQDQVLPAAAPGHLRSVAFADSRRGVAVGEQTDESGNPIALGFTTMDGGVTWEAARFPPETPELRSVIAVP